MLRHRLSISDNVLVDTSALLALFQREKGANQVKALIGTMIMSTVNVAETLSVLRRTQIFSLESLPFVCDVLQSIVNFDLTHARIAAELELKTRFKRSFIGGSRVSYPGYPFASAHLYRRSSMGKS